MYILQGWVRFVWLCRRSQGSRDEGAEGGIVRVDIVEVCKILGGALLQNHQRVEIGRRQIDFGAGKDRVKILGQPRVFLRHQHIPIEKSFFPFF